MLFRSNLVAKFQAFREKFQGPELTRKLRSEGISTRELEQEYFYLLFEQASLKETPAESLHVQIMQDYRTENHHLIEKCKKQEATLVEVASRAKKIGCQVTPKLLETKCPEI